ncbi:MAG: 4-hydroxy-3-methylbut-2-en-1-yl diphosphate synthase (flavodoxin) [Thermonema sp.]|uniref:(E)-4-hydroxy-3-methylbut-2-enyl-diphosphate synthase n=1 Tax=Thermonema sp. TaxID=2231181 RepID=UPI0021DC992B|nr:(E)-4-hydroxy-3-methylbut-2-enyl-diphosphate synthase [Thermonema sp.]GIV38810.1 MAG: 4-hydroxy-3-methylbut-2-en-1-yl diphosphate synthase (flavodoxin) [Thermonema sp.]
MELSTAKPYCPSLTTYRRRPTVEVHIGDLPLGSMHPIRVQSMTTADTMDTQAVVQECIRLIEAGCEYVRITAPSIKEAENLANIKKELRRRGYTTPLIADIHFTPNAAELAARIVEKVRINPGNYADKKRFEIIEYTDAAYEAELERIRKKFIPLVKICKEYGTAMRIGTNHGSLSDRIMSRYGDTPLGMVESALEFLRICEEFDYHNIVLSMKASNPQVMVQAYRLLVQKMEEEGMQPYPLHLGVTEAGDGEDGRIKSAMGIGALLEDGLGDTIRVSLTEDPVEEIPVAKALAERYHKRARTQEAPLPEVIRLTYNPFAYQRRHSRPVLSVGGEQVPRVIADYSHFTNIEPADLKPIGHYYLPATDKWHMTDDGADFVYLGRQAVPFMLPNGLKAIQDYEVWKDEPESPHVFPLITFSRWQQEDCRLHTRCNFVRLSVDELLQADNTARFHDGNIVLVLHTGRAHAMPALRRAFLFLMEQDIRVPVVVERRYNEAWEQSILYASTDIGGLLLDGMGDGVFLRPAVEDKDKAAKLLELKQLNQLAFGILQASRTRTTKTEYIACPSCGRTLFDLQETTAMIRRHTEHLKGVKIGIMGCIVNGPGEMADADYGYVGSGKGKITLYRGKEVVRRNVPSEEAVQALIELIREDGRWIEPPAPVE